jgi:predicted Rossmann-fold nucleotide-binding protein
MGVLNVNGYYDGLAALLDNAVAQGFLRAEHRASLHAEPTPEALLGRFDGWKPSALAKWL